METVCMSAPRGTLGMHRTLTAQLLWVQVELRVVEVDGTADQESPAGEAEA